MTARPEKQPSCDTAPRPGARVRGSTLASPFGVSLILHVAAVTLWCAGVPGSLAGGLDQPVRASWEPAPLLPKLPARPPAPTEPPAPEAEEVDPAPQMTDNAWPEPDEEPLETLRPEAAPRLRPQRPFDRPPRHPAEPFRRRAQTEETPVEQQPREAPSKAEAEAASPLAAAPAAAPSGPTSLAKPKDVSASLARLRRRATRSRWSGRIELQVEVDAAGRVTAVQALRSDPGPAAARLVEAAVLGWRFEPARRGTEPLPCTLSIPFEF